MFSACRKFLDWCDKLKPIGAVDWSAATARRRRSDQVERRCGRIAISALPTPRGMMCAGKAGIDAARQSRCRPNRATEEPPASGCDSTLGVCCRRGEFEAIHQHADLGRAVAGCCLLDRGVGIHDADVFDRRDQQHERCPLPKSMRPADSCRCRCRRSAHRRDRAVPHIDRASDLELAATIRDVWADAQRPVISNVPAGPGCRASRRGACSVGDVCCCAATRLHQCQPVEQRRREAQGPRARCDGRCA